MNWKVGDQAIIICSRGKPELEGERVTITALGAGKRGNCCEVDIPAINTFTRGPHGGLCYQPNHLKPIDKYDGMEVTTWDECPFTPRELVS